MSTSDHRGAGAALPITPFPGGRPAASKVQSNIVYEIMTRQESDGLCVPLQIGKGKFAKVYKAWQRSAGRNIRPVAIKVLHDYANKAAERLFKQELDLLKELTTNANVVETVDITHLGPMVMCGCGQVYHPHCPRCGALPLQRRDPPDEIYPALHCSGCGYELSGQHVDQQTADLLRPPAKLCCQSGPRARSGVIINFVEREVLVMELLDHDFTDFTALRRRTLHKICQAYGIPLEVSGVVAAAAAPETSLMGRLLPGRKAKSEVALLQRAVLLEKLQLVIQLGETVAWMHGEKKVVHKDLAPDNVMVKIHGRGAQHLRELAFSELLDDLVCHPGVTVKVIDFGLADKDQLSRSWYEEEDAKGLIKSPYMSPEARERITEITESVLFDPAGSRFQIPQNLYTSPLSVMPGDILADQNDASHDYDLEIEEIIKEPSGRVYARYRGDPPPTPLNRRFILVRRLGEPHDVYSLGALLYYVLTGNHGDVDQLASLVRVLRDAPCELTPVSLMRYPNYPIRRDAIREPFFRDELMGLILRAMVRGQPQSLVPDRMVRGPQSALRFLQELKRIYHGLQADYWAQRR